MIEKIGLVGFGIMGAEMASRLRDHAYSVLISDSSASAVAEAKRLGYDICETPAEMAELTEVVLMSLPKPEHVNTVVRHQDTGLLATAETGMIIVDTSTVDPTTSRENAEYCEERGVGYLDCPVLGRPSGCGNWTLPTGGSERYIEAVRPILQTFAAKVIPVGPSGHGNLVKVLNNLMFGSINSITCEVFALCRCSGMDPKLLFETISNSGAGTVSNLFKELGPKIIDNEYSPVFSIDNLQKDIQLGIDLAAAYGMELKMSELGQEMNVAAQLAGFGKQDTSAVVKVYEKISKAESNN